MTVNELHKRTLCDARPGLVRLHQASHDRRCSNGRSICSVMIKRRVLAGLKDCLMVSEKAAEAMKAYAEETNRLNREPAYRE